MKVWAPVLLIAVLLATGVSWLAPRLSAPPDRLQVARALLEEGRAVEAVHLFETPDWKGVAEYRAGRYHRALGAFFQHETATNLYNMGNAYAQLQEWKGARAAYEKALSLDPGHADAAHNLAIINEAEKLQNAQVAASRSERRLGIWRDSDRERKSEGGADGGERIEQGDNTTGDTEAADGQSGQAGQGAGEGRLGETRLSTETMVGAASGDPAQDQPDDLKGQAKGASVLLESTIAAEVLLRRIRDDPARVLSARLQAIDRQRREREGACSDC